MRHPWSIARRIAVVHVALVAAIALFSVWSAYLQAREVAQRVEERHVHGVTALVARDPALVSALRAGDAPALQAGIDGWIAEAQVSWLTVMDPDGMRLASWRPEQVGVRYPKPVDAVVAGDTVVELSSTGAAGRSVRALAPVVDPEDGTVLGVVTTGVQISDVAIMAQAQIPGILLGSAAVAAVGLLVAWLVGRYLNRVTLGRGPEQIAEQFLLAETAMDSLEAGVVVLAPDGRARLHNDAAARLLGWEGAGEPRLPTELSAALPGAVGGEASLAAGGRVLVVQQRVVRSPGRSDPGGSVPPTALAAAAREGVTTAPAGSRVLVLHDRTDLQRLGDELTVAHTLTTALRAQTHEHANQLHTALALVESGRLEAARAVLSRRAADEEASDDVLAALLDAKAAQARERGVALTWSAELTAPAPLRPLDLLTVLGNLVDNALDAAAAPDLSAADRWVDVEVVSDAAGLLVQGGRRRPRTLRRGPRPTLRPGLVDEARRRRRTRHGAVADAADRGGGRRGRGRRDRLGHRVHRRGAPHPPTPGGDMTARPYRVLVVEDEQLTAETYVAHLDRLPGFEVAAVAGSLLAARQVAAAGLHADGRFPFDVVLLDMNLPDGHGLDFLHQLRAAGFHGGVLALTAATDLPVVRRAVAYGVTQYLVKPFGFDEFADRLGGFRAASAMLAGDGALDGQEQVDAVFRVSRERRAEALPKGLTEGTLREVVELLGADPETALSAAEVGERLGISRVTARRYLEHLERIRRVRRSARHGGRGRPEQEYRWAGRT